MRKNINAKIDPNAGIDPSMNCHGYSTGLSTWINEINTLLEDEYVPTTHRDHLVPGTIFARPYVYKDWVIISNNPSFKVGDHSSKVEAVHLLAGTHDLAVTVVEKNRLSALYEKTFTMEALCPDKDTDPMAHTHTDPCDMANAPLPWKPVGFYRELP